ncbi:M28 family metallopeptidase [Nocardioides sp.]|uniref:M28 family metallopeptidase n=1 Tax=Nocardioides sp. TaxID=35761 RepID=UPI002D800BF7|nr:M28 family metallopeptidase [Nocardioides sp.]
MVTHTNSRAGGRGRTAACATGLALLAAAALPATAWAGPDDRTNTTSKSLRAAVTPAGVMEHLEALDAIGTANGGTRASGTPGYAASRDYVVSKLRAAGYTPEVQAFEFPFYRQLAPATFEQVAPTPTSYAEGTDYATMTYSGSGDVTAAVQGVDLALDNLAVSTSGCEDADFAGFTAGNIALIRRGTCSFGEKVVNAQEAGASAVIVMNQGTEGRTDAFAGTLGAPVGTVPAIGTSFAIGQALAVDGAQAHVAASTESEMRTTWNVFAETKGGDAENVVMTGAHLDSVVPGPGVNDNGSGSAAILEVAEAMAKVKPVNKVRFAWWGAEELGLLGSEHYVADLEANDPEKLGDIALYLNFDMVGSPNYALFVYDGDNSKFPVGPSAAEGPAGSGAIEDLFHDYFASVNTPSAETPFSGRSDYGPFIAVGIPAGGLFTGAEGIKTAEEAALFGGTAGEAYDPCYHQACDTIANVSVDAIDANSDAIAHAILSYAMSTKSVNGSTKGHPVGPATPDGEPSGTGTPEGGGLHDDHDHDGLLS